MEGGRTARGAVNEYGVIGKRVADAISLQDDMTLVGVADVVSDYRMKLAVERRDPVYAPIPEKRREMEEAGIPVAGSLDDLLRQVDAVADCTPKKVGARNRSRYETAGCDDGWRGAVQPEPHSFSMVETTRTVSVDELHDALWDAPRIALVRAADGLVALNCVIELMRDLDRPRGDMWEVAIWEDALAVDDRELYLTVQVHNESIVVPETIDCIRALTGIETDGAPSIEKTDRAMGIAKTFLPATTRPVTPVAGADVWHPPIASVRARRAEFTAAGFTGAAERLIPNRILSGRKHKETRCEKSCWKPEDSCAAARRPRYRAFCPVYQAFMRSRPIPSPTQ